MKRSAPASNSAARVGFTLLELLLAIGLCGMLMTATMGALHLSWKYRVEGDWAVEQSERARGVHADLSLDLRNAINPSPHSNNLSAGVPEAAFAALQAVIELEAAAEPDPISGPQFETSTFETSDFSEQFLNVEVTSNPTPIHFFGEPEFFAMLVGQSSHRFPGSNSDLLTHVVWTAAPAAVQIPFHQRNDRQVRSTIAPESSGLVRLERQFDPRTEAVPPVIEHAILPKLERATFRYFDGRTWELSWDSSVKNRLPQAVEVTLQPNADRQSATQFVVRLPQAILPEASR